jgi:membrane protein DedA with SNARE-associated domain
VEHLVSTQIANHGYLAVYLLMTVCACCIPIPSEAVMLFGGALTTAAFVASVAHGAHRLSLVPVALLGSAGDVTGACIAYWIGRGGGRPLVERWGRLVRLRAHELDRAHAFFERRGEVTVMVGRVVPLIRAFVSLPAGLAEMSFARFVGFTVLGSLPWTFGLALGGRAIGSHWKGVVHDFTPIGYALAALAVVAIAVWLVRRFRLPPESAPAEAS